MHRVTLRHLAPGRVSHDLNIGRVLRGRYRLESRLGHGGMGVVYRATQLPINRPVAVKLLLPGPHADRHQREQRFQREAEATASLREEHTVRVFDFGVTELQEPFLVMELLHGCDLESVLSRAGRLKPEVAVWVARQVLLGLAEAHALGITHRDLKPSNVFLARRHTGKTCAKVVDFGIARFDGSRVSAKVTDTGTLLGTPAYMPPEQLQGAPADARGDLYSLGAMLFETLTGRPPFDHGPLGDVLQGHIARTPPRLDALVPTLAAPGSLQAFLDRLLAKRPQERFQDCAAALRALEVVQRELRGLPGATPGAGSDPPGFPAACAHCMAGDTRPSADPLLAAGRIGLAWLCMSLLVVLFVLGRQLLAG